MPSGIASICNDARAAKARSCVLHSVEYCTGRAAGAAPARTHGRLAAGLLPSVLLGACATPPQPAAQGEWISGRLLIRIDAHDDRAAQAVNAAFELGGDDRAGELRLSSPLGTRLAQAHWTPLEARLVTPQGEQRYADLADLSRAQFGEALPMRALPDWLRGRPWPGAPSRPLASAGFEQLGWTVDTSRAGRIDAQRPGPPEIRLRALLDDPR